MAEYTSDLPLIPFPSNPYEVVLQEIQRRTEKHERDLSVDLCLQVLHSDEFQGMIPGDSDGSKLAALVRVGAQGSAKKTAQAIADAVCKSDFVPETQKEKEVFEQHASRAGKIWSAIKDWVSATAKKVFRYVKIKSGYIQGKLTGYALTALKETLAAKQFTPGALATNFGVNFAKAIKDDPDVNEFAKEFEKEFLKQLTQNATLLENWWKVLHPGASNE